MNHAARTVLNYVGAVAYRKFDRQALNIPAFHTGIPSMKTSLAPEQHRYMLSDLSTMDRKAREILPCETRRGRGIVLPTHLRSRLGLVQDLIEGKRSDPRMDFIARLSHVLSNCARALRWEPFNTYQVHRGIASARCLFTCDVRVSVRDGGNGKYRTYRYIGDEHLLLQLDGEPVEVALFGGAPLVFSISGDIARCIDPYGEFAPNLVGPEAGLLLGQLEFLCAAVGWQTDARAVFDVRAARQQMKLAHDTEIAMSILVVENSDVDLSGEESVEVEFTEPRWPRHLIEQFDVLSPLLLAAQDPWGPERARVIVGERLRAVQPLPEVAPPDAAFPDDLDVLDLVRKRNSGSYLIGFVPRAEGFNGPRLDQLLQDWLRLARLGRSNELLGVEVSAYLSALRISGRCPARYQMDFRKGNATLVEERDLTELFASASTMPMANFRELNIVVTFTCDFGREIAVLGPQAFFLAHQATGWLAHAFGLAAARQGMFSRPVRMYNDGVLDALIHFDGQPTIQLLCGSNRGPKVSFEIG